ncbi:hypothetical protein BUALT_BualtUnG0012900 [Buddleja alternifolia]|uniref:MATH domain-containing protein n=1 Tax=Buddleja alternifolia TaxID=168488 RepID=A0AAV6W7K8_9LAMI|nr:hypothetical protein BUALT_BualtUnG0012900 [Buddleja alternifolia]
MALNLVDDEDVTMETSEVSPSHVLFRIESFSMLDKYGTEKYESGEFMADHYKWKLIVFPTGNKNGKGDYISVYLAMTNTSSLASNWEVNAVFSIFLFNQISCNYLVTKGITRRFLSMKSEWGFSKFISKKIFTDPSNGYIVDDNCVFGAEVFSVKNKLVVDRLSMLKVITPYTRVWKISKFSTLKDHWTSENFIVADHNWYMLLYPKGHKEEVGRSVSIYLSYVGPNPKVMANFSICLRNQINSQHCKKRASHWFSPSTYWGFPKFLSLVDMDDTGEGFIVNDCCILEIEISVQAIAHGCK